MKPEMIDKFFVLLDQELNLEADIILIGASAASLMGHVRPSLDIDFEIRPKSKASKTFKLKAVKAIAFAQATLKVAVDYSENIKGWSMINYLDYRKTAIPYKQIGKLNVKLIAPEYWTIGKMARFLELDIQDMKKIIREKAVSPDRLRLIWTKAILSSDLSLELGQFKDHVIFFVKQHGRQIWGKSFDPGLWIDQFQKKLS
jgi:hypothetical protein